MGSGPSDFRPMEIIRELDNIRSACFCGKKATYRNKYVLAGIPGGQGYLSSCPLSREIILMARIMGIWPSVLRDLAYRLCGFYHCGNHPGVPTKLYEHRTCLEMVTLFEQMLVFLQSEDAEGEIALSVGNDQRLFGEMTDEEVVNALDLRQKVNVRANCQRWLNQSYVFKDDVNVFVESLAVKLGLERNQFKPLEPSEPGARDVRAVIREFVDNVWSSEAVDIRELIRDPFCLLLRREQETAAKKD